MQPQPVDKKLIRIYINDRCTPEQLAVIRQYLHDPVYQESLQDWLLRDWQQISAETYSPEADADQKYQEYLALVKPAPPVKQLSPLRWWKVAAAAVIISVVAFSGWRWQQARQQRHAAEHQWVQLHNEAGKRTKITLPDSSQVYLDALSSLRYNQNFGITNRRIILEGEAYFIVRHGGAHPFSVQTAGLTTVDVGTAFNVRYRPTEPSIRVAVAEGAVNVMHSQQPEVSPIATLTQQQQLLFDAGTRKATVQLLPDTASIGAWRHGILIFRKQSLKEVAAELQRYYGISIQFTHPELGNGIITTTLHHSTIDEALDIVAMTAGVTAKRSGKTVLIK